MARPSITYNGSTPVRIPPGPLIVTDIAHSDHHWQWWHLPRLLALEQIARRRVDDAFIEFFGTQWFHSPCYIAFIDRAMAYHPRPGPICVAAGSNLISITVLPLIGISCDWYPIWKDQSSNLIRHTNVQAPLISEMKTYLGAPLQDRYTHHGFSLSSVILPDILRLPICPSYIRIY